MIKIIASDWDLICSKDRDENEDWSQCHGGKLGHNICLCCGKIIKNLNNRKSLRLIEGGSYLTEYEGELDEDFDMGWWYVGSACYKKFLKNRKEIEVE